VVIYQPNPQPPELACIIAGKVPDAGYGSALRGQAELRRQQTKLNADIAERRRLAAEERELAAQNAREGRYF